MLFLFQILWIQFTISKLNKLVPVAITYEAKEKQIFSFIPVYIISLLLFGLTVYTKFFLIYSGSVVKNKNLKIFIMN